MERDRVATRRRARHCWRTALALSAVAAIVAGCSYLGMRREMAELQRELTLLGGNVGVEPPGGRPLLVILFAERGGRFEAIDFFPLRGPGAYFFTVIPGRYAISAFEDADDDLVFRSTERFGHARGARPIPTRGGERIDDLDIRVTRGAAPPLLAPIDALAVWRDSGTLRANVPHGGPASGGSLVEFGTVVAIGDPRFSDANARMGLWQPIQFLIEVGWGIYFLEPYDPAKTPILFVHGAEGHPGQWAYVVRHLDRRRFQPWLVYYPTAFRLDRMGTRMAIEVELLRRAYPFERIFVVAHSMGGLLSRDLIEQLAQRRSAQPVRLFASLSTPWNGAPAAAWARHPPPAGSLEDLRPFYYDMAPGSPFLSSLLATALPEHTPYYLLYGTQDRTVERESLLDPRASRAAREVLSFPASHVGILSTPSAASDLNRILTQADD